MKFQQQDSLKHYNYLEEVVSYILALVPNDINGEILQTSYKVSLKGFWEALQISLREKYQNTEFFLVRIWILFTQCYVIVMFQWSSFMEDLLEKVCCKNFF